MRGGRSWRGRGGRGRERGGLGAGTGEGAGETGFWAGFDFAVGGGFADLGGHDGETCAKAEGEEDSGGDVEGAIGGAVDDSAELGGFHTGAFGELAVSPAVCFAGVDDGVGEVEAEFVADTGGGGFELGEVVEDFGDSGVGHWGFSFRHEPSKRIAPTRRIRARSAESSF